MKYVVYALYNKEAGKIYIGYTDNLERRIREHNEKRGNHFTSKISGGWIVIYKEGYNSQTEAIIRERSLKSYQGRKFIKKLI